MFLINKSIVQFSIIQSPNSIMGIKIVLAMCFMHIMPQGTEGLQLFIKFASRIKWQVFAINQETLFQPIPAVVWQYQRTVNKTLMKCREIHAHSLKLTDSQDCGSDAGVRFRCNSPRVFNVILKHTTVQRFGVIFCFEVNVLLYSKWTLDYSKVKWQFIML